jgi:hypothetical protein
VQDALKEPSQGRSLPRSRTVIALVDRSPSPARQSGCVVRAMVGDDVNVEKQARIVEGTQAPDCRGNHGFLIVRGYCNRKPHLRLAP